MIKSKFLKIIKKIVKVAKQAALSAFSREALNAPIRVRRVGCEAGERLWICFAGAKENREPNSFRVLRNFDFL